MKLPRRNFLHLAAGAAALPAVSRIARAQAYPARPVHIIVPFAPAGDTDLTARIGRSGIDEADHPHRRLLRACRERSRRRAAEQCDELAPRHSITSSARSRSVGGIVIPISIAVFRFTASSNLEGCSIGSSAGFVPRRTLSTRLTTCR